MTDITDTLEENSASDIVADAKAWLADIGGGQRLQTHSGNCHKWHSTCLVSKLTREIERLRTPATHATPTQGSVQGEGSVPDSRNWKEPVAWAVMQNDWYHDAHLDYYKAVKLATAANVAGAKNPWNVVPLYRHPPCQNLLQKNFTLTDEDREAVDFAADFLDGRAVAATLRNLLERLHT